MNRFATCQATSPSKIAITNSSHFVVVGLEGVSAGRVARRHRVFPVKPLWTTGSLRTAVLHPGPYCLPEPKRAS